MNIDPMKDILMRINTIVEAKGTMRKVLAEAMGYGGKETTKITSATNILTGKREMLTQHLNSIASFYRYPVGFFLFGDENSEVQTINDDQVRKILNILFQKEEQQEKAVRKKKYILGAMLGYAADENSQFTTAHYILKGKRKLKVRDIFICADFFDISIHELLDSKITS